MTFYYKNELLQNKFCMKRKDKQGNKAGFFCLKLVGFTCLSYEQSPTEKSSTGTIQDTFFKPLLEMRSFWKLCLFRFTTWYYLYMRVAKFTVLPATLISLNRAKTLKIQSESWLIRPYINPLLISPTINSKKAFPAPAWVSNSFTAHKDDHDWGTKSK